MISVYKDFITIEEQEELEAWANSRWDLLRRRWRYNSDHKTGERRSRYLRDHPEWIKQRIIDKFGFQSVWLPKLVMHEQGSSTQPHMDMRKPFPDKVNIRANILIRAANQGGRFKIEGEFIDFPERSLLHYVGDTEHEVTEIIEGNRICLTHFIIDRKPIIFD